MKKKKLLSKLMLNKHTVANLGAVKGGGPDPFETEGPTCLGSQCVGTCNTCVGCPTDDCVTALCTAGCTYKCPTDPLICDTELC